MRKNLSGFMFDVRNGYYKVTLLFPKSYETSTFDVYADNNFIFRFVSGKKKRVSAYKKSFILNVNHNRGIFIKFVPVKGETFLSAIRIKRIY